MKYKPFSPRRMIFFSMMIALVISSARSIVAVDESSPVKKIRARRVTGLIEIDGKLLEPEWKNEGAGGFTQTDPHDGEPATEATLVWVAYDLYNLYVAARMYDSRPEEISGRLGRRDEDVESDWFDWGIDPYLDRRSGYYFSVNPSGSLQDGTLFNDESFDATWDGIWEVAVHRDEKGWSAEFRVPFDQLRFKRKDEYTWGINFQRILLRNNETDFFAWHPKEENGLVSRFAILEGLQDIVPGRRLAFSPFASFQGGLHPREGGNPFRTGRNLEANFGLDMKAGLRSNLTLDATFNPDFGQVEVDPAVINISDQETYYQEKRPFFIEGANIFSFGRGGANVFRQYGWSSPAFFYSRRIGRSPQGTYAGEGYAEFPDWTAILGAAKVTGRTGGGFNLGIVSALTAREYAEIDMGGIRSRTEVEPLSFYGVFRGLQEFSGGRSGLGMIATTVFRDLRAEPLESQLAAKAFTLGFDGWTFLDSKGTWSISGWIGGSGVYGTPQAMTALQRSSLHYFQRPDIGYAHVNEDATALTGWAGRIFLNKQKGNFIFNSAIGAVSPGFEANDLGYHTRGDLINAHVETGYQVFHPGRVFRNWKVTSAYFRNYDFGWNRVGETIYLTGDTQFLNYWNAMLRLDYDPPKTSHYLTRGGPMAFYPSGATAMASLSSDGRKVFSAQVNGYYRYHPSGGYSWSLGGGVTWKPRSNVSLSISPSWTFRYAESQWVREVTDPLKVSTNGIRYVLSDIIQKTLPVEIRLNWTFTPKLSLQVYIQPYLGTGDFSRFKELAAARTFNFFYYGEGDSTIHLQEGLYTVDPDGAGPATEFSFADPDFNVKSLRGTVILRWEYRPGSLLYFVWTQKRQDGSHPGDFDFGRDWAALWRSPGDHLFMLKFTYRFDT